MVVTPETWRKLRGPMRLVAVTWSSCGTAHVEQLPWHRVLRVEAGDRWQRR